MPDIEIYTDGSCHTQKCVGAWIAIILVDEKKIVLSETENNTTHNRMELVAVIKALEYVSAHYKKVCSITIVSDSQYVIGLNSRKEKLIGQNFNTATGKEIRNIALVKEFFFLSGCVRFVKIKAHQKKTSIINYNIEADVLVRKIMRETLK